MKCINRLVPFRFEYLEGVLDTKYQPTLYAVKSNIAILVFL